MSTRLNRQLDRAGDYLLDRGRYECRGVVPYAREQVGAGLRCGSHRCDHFRRNGHRPGTLSRWGCALQLRLPWVVCQCGGSVQLDLAGLIRPYQRLGDDVDAQIQRWGVMSVSLRKMRAELAHSHLGALGLRLMERLHDLQALTPTSMPTQSRRFYGLTPSGSPSCRYWGVESFQRRRVKRKRMGGICITESIALPDEANRGKKGK